MPACKFRRSGLVSLAATIALTFLPGQAFAAADAMTPQEARHLISRTGFGAAPHEIAAFTGLSYAEGVLQLLDGVQTTTTTQMPDWTQEWVYPTEVWTLGQTQAELYYTNRWIEMQQLGGWWLSEMAATPSPLTERLVLFWSDHFASSFDTHENSHWLTQQNAFFRTHAMGDFSDLAQGILRDPAMLEYLDNTSNFPDAPNENLGREFLELFTLGEGRGYTQHDVRAAARILTGNTVAEMGTPRFIFDPELHDPGRKTLFGQTGRFRAEDLVNLTLTHSEFGPYIVEKLWRTFISDRPEPAEVERLTQIWIRNDLQMRPLLKAMFLSDAFWDPANRGRLVKSPVELLVGTSRSLGFGLTDARELAWMLEELGQTPFLPPNVGGWPEGVGWINDATASGRATALTYLLYEVGDEVEPATQPAMMTMQDPLMVPVASEPGDLRVGQVFATYMEDRDPSEGVGGMITLFDVSFGGETWRSIPIWLEYDDSESWAGLYPYTHDCETGCLTSFPSEDDDGWVALEPWPGMQADMPGITDQDWALMQAIGTHLPALVETTRDQAVYQGNDTAEWVVPAAFGPVLEGAQVFSQSSIAAIGRHEGALILAPSRPNAIGLGSNDLTMAGTDRDAYVEALEEASGVSLLPAVTYASAQEWLDRLPGDGGDLERAAAALLAVPPMDVQWAGRDPEALLRSIILSPAYQVN